MNAEDETIEAMLLLRSEGCMSIPANEDLEYDNRNGVIRRIQTLSKHVLTMMELIETGESTFGTPASLSSKEYLKVNDIVGCRESRQHILPHYSEYLNRDTSALKIARCDDEPNFAINVSAALENLKFPCEPQSPQSHSWDLRYTNAYWNNNEEGMKQSLSEMIIATLPTCVEMFSSKLKDFSDKTTVTKDKCEFQGSSTRTDKQLYKQELEAGSAIENCKQKTLLNVPLAYTVSCLDMKILVRSAVQRASLPIFGRRPCDEELSHTQRPVRNKIAEYELKKIASELNLSGHWVGSLSRRVFIYTNTDSYVVLGADNRYYLLGINRLLPPLKPLTTNPHEYLERRLRHEALLILKFHTRWLHNTRKETEALPFCTQLAQSRYGQLYNDTDQGFQKMAYAFICNKPVATGVDADADADAGGGVHGDRISLDTSCFQEFALSSENFNISNFLTSTFAAVQRVLVPQLNVDGRLSASQSIASLSGNDEPPEIKVQESAFSSSNNMKSTRRSPTSPRRQQLSKKKLTKSTTTPRKKRSPEPKTDVLKESSQSTFIDDDSCGSLVTILSPFDLTDNNDVQPDQTTQNKTTDLFATSNPRDKNSSFSGRKSSAVVKSKRSSVTWKRHRNGEKPKNSTGLASKEHVIRRGARTGSNILRHITIVGSRRRSLRKKSTTSIKDGREVDLNMSCSAASDGANDFDFINACQNIPSPVSSDSYSPFGYNRRTHHNHNCNAVTSLIETSFIKAAATSITSEAQSIVLRQIILLVGGIPTIIHRHGCNLHHMGLVLQHLTDVKAVQALQIEMTARAIKSAISGAVQTEDCILQGIELKAVGFDKVASGFVVSISEGDYVQKIIMNKYRGTPIFDVTEIDNKILSAAVCRVCHLYRITQVAPGAKLSLKQLYAKCSVRLRSIRCPDLLLTDDLEREIFSKAAKRIIASGAVSRTQLQMASQYLVSVGEDADFDDFPPPSSLELPAADRRVKLSKRHAFRYVTTLGSELLLDIGNKTMNEYNLAHGMIIQYHCEDSIIEDGVSYGLILGTSAGQVWRHDANYEGARPFSGSSFKTLMSRYAFTWIATTVPISLGNRKYLPLHQFLSPNASGHVEVTRIGPTSILQRFISNDSLYLKYGFKTGDKIMHLNNTKRGITGIILGFFSSGIWIHDDDGTHPYVLKGDCYDGIQETYKLRILAKTSLSDHDSSGVLAIRGDNNFDCLVSINNLDSYSDCPLAIRDVSSISTSVLSTTYGDLHEILIHHGQIITQISESNTDGDNEKYLVLGIEHDSTSVWCEVIADLSKAPPQELIVSEIRKIPIKTFVETNYKILGSISPFSSKRLLPHPCSRILYKIRKSFIKDIEIVLIDITTSACMAFNLYCGQRIIVVKGYYAQSQGVVVGLYEDGLWVHLSELVAAVQLQPSNVKLLRCKQSDGFEFIENNSNLISGGNISISTPVPLRESINCLAITGEVLQFNNSFDCCRRYNLFPGQLIIINNDKCVVVGFALLELWYRPLHCDVCFPIRMHELYGYITVVGLCDDKDFKQFSDFLSFDTNDVRRSSVRKSSIPSNIKNHIDDITGLSIGVDTSQEELKMFGVSEGDVIQKTDEVKTKFSTKRIIPKELYRQHNHESSGPIGTVVGTCMGKLWLRRVGTTRITTVPPNELHLWSVTSNQSILKEAARTAPESDETFCDSILLSAALLLRSPQLLPWDFNGVVYSERLVAVRSTASLKNKTEAIAKLQEIKYEDTLRNSTSYRNWSESKKALLVKVADDVSSRGSNSPAFRAATATKSDPHEDEQLTNFISQRKKSVDKKQSPTARAQKNAEKQQILLERKLSAGGSKFSLQKSPRTIFKGLSLEGSLRPSEVDEWSPSGSPRSSLFEKSRNHTIFTTDTIIKEVAFIGLNENKSRLGRSQAVTDFGCSTRTDILEFASQSVQNSPDGSFKGNRSRKLGILSENTKRTIGGSQSFANSLFSRSDNCSISAIYESASEFRFKGNALAAEKEALRKLYPAKHSYSDTSSQSSFSDGDEKLSLGRISALLLPKCHSSIWEVNDPTEKNWKLLSSWEYINANATSEKINTYDSKYRSITVFPLIHELYIDTYVKGKRKIRKRNVYSILEFAEKVGFIAWKKSVQWRELLCSKTKEAFEILFSEEVRKSIDPVTGYVEYVLLKSELFELAPVVVGNVVEAFRSVITRQHLSSEINHRLASYPDCCHPWILSWMLQNIGISLSPHSPLNQLKSSWLAYENWLGSVVEVPYVDNFIELIHAMRVLLIEDERIGRIELENAQCNNIPTNEFSLLEAIPETCGLSLSEESQSLVENYPVVKKESTEFHEYLLTGSRTVHFDISKSTSTPFGYHSGELIKCQTGDISDQESIILGCYEGKLWRYNKESSMCLILLHCFFLNHLKKKKKKNRFCPSISCN